MRQCAWTLSDRSVELDKLLKLERRGTLSVQFSVQSARSNGDHVTAQST
jgi:hypothetical protein